ncbi:BBSome-interacting protein 1-like [Orussus abietinus]|uniref:BBSome-interacting protein 1-like n=1 Tax=Orussus abietinus TaxID=222816 RepID=UPI0006253C9F|nr:BBSome-interacting protein 1-like [Orussus abietinus]XP_012280911.1 BBSome-interacting protein 1-like [Orussus abietinus]XP_023290614.1 BBSome-interacting protein 1-like [Orussus abietinus]
MSETTEKTEEEVGFVLPDDLNTLVYNQEVVDYVLCKPKLMPLKSMTLQKLEKMQKDAELKLKEARELDDNTNSSKQS